MAKGIADKRAARAVTIATLAVEIVGSYETPEQLQKAVIKAENLLAAAEDLVAKKYGEFR